jgi:pimeloyl-ACP methyl ester carboxylesterase
MFNADGFKGLQKTPKTMPIGLFVFGDGDKFLSIENVDKTKRFVPKLQVEIIKNGNHFVQQDEPEAVNSAIREFLNSFWKK